jgi:hypothetical protein
MHKEKGNEKWNTLAVNTFILFYCNFTLFNIMPDDFTCQEESTAHNA